MTWLMLLWIACIAWFVYRICFARKFLLWDWSDGTVDYFWRKPPFRKDDNE
jgi:hypothetical protein